MALLTLIAYIPWIYPWIKWTYSNCKTIGELFCGVVSISFRIVKEHQLSTRCLSHGWLTINNQTKEGWLFMGKNLVEPGGIEPPTPCLQSRCSPSWAMAPLQNWWVWEDLNCRPHPYQGCALTNWATGLQKICSQASSIPSHQPIQMKTNVWALINACHISLRRWSSPRFP